MFLEILVVAMTGLFVAVVGVLLVEHLLNLWHLFETEQQFVSFLVLD